MIMLQDQPTLKCLTRLVAQAFGKDHPAVVKLKLAWNNEDATAHQDAWDAITALGTAVRDALLLRAKKECETNDWLTRGGKKG